MQDDVDQGQPKELAERRIPRHKTKEKIGVDEGFVKGVEEEVSQSQDPSCQALPPSSRVG
jgi:hypothetical protein